jgi:hypothetical protein
MPLNVYKSEFWLAIIAGLTVSLGLAPSAYWIYFDRIGWPHPYITHYGPLWGTRGGHLLCWGNIAFLCIFPLITLVLAAKRLSVKRDFFSYLYLALPFAQFFGGILNLMFLLTLLD